jgi:hypothetical protein
LRGTVLCANGQRRQEHASNEIARGNEKNFANHG